MCRLALWISTGRLRPGAVNGKWFDLLGRKLPSKPKRGIYIKDGRKVLYSGADRSAAPYSLTEKHSVPR